MSLSFEDVIEPLGCAVGDGGMFLKISSTGHVDRQPNYSSKAIKAHLDDYESKGHRGEPFQFSEKKYQINHANLAVVAFVQDEKTKEILQAVYLKVVPATSQGNR